MDLMKGKDIQHKTKGEENKTLSTPCWQICKHTHICMEQKLEGNVLYCSFVAFGNVEELLLSLCATIFLILSTICKKQ